MKPKYQELLPLDQHLQLQALVDTGMNSAYRIEHALLLLAVDRDGPAWSDEQAVQAYHCHTDTVHNVRRRFVEQGQEEALERKKQAWPSRRSKLDGEGQAHLTRMAYSPASDGRNRWTLELLGAQLVELRIVESTALATVMLHLKKRVAPEFAGAMGEPAPAERRVCGTSGGRSGGLLSPLHSFG